MKIETTKDEVLAEIVAEMKAPPAVFRNHTFSPLSRVHTLVRAIRNSQWLYIDSVLVTLQKAIHPHTSEPDDLHEWLRRYGLEWKDAVAAIHRIRIGSTTQPITDVPLAQGLIVRTQEVAGQTIRFRLTESLVLYSTVPQDVDGKWTVEAYAEAIVPGVTGNVAQDSIVELEAPPDGIDYVRNYETDPATAGAPKESVASVRARIALAEISQAQTFWTPAWYLSEALSFASVERAAFRSAKDIGTDGEVQILCRGSSGLLNSTEKTELEDHFADESRNPGGAAHVSIGDLAATDIDRTVTVTFSAVEFLLSDNDLQAIADEYIFALDEGEDWIEADFKSPFYALQGVTGVSISPLGDTAVSLGSVAVYGAGWAITGVVS